MSCAKDLGLELFRVQTWFRNHYRRDDGFSATGSPLVSSKSAHDPPELILERLKVKAETSEQTTAAGSAGEAGSNETTDEESGSAVEPLTVKVRKPTATSVSKSHVAAGSAQSAASSTKPVKSKTKVSPSSAASSGPSVKTVRSPPMPAKATAPDSEVKSPTPSAPKPATAVPQPKPKARPKAPRPVADENPYARSRFIEAVSEKAALARAIRESLEQASRSTTSRLRIDPAQSAGAAATVSAADFAAPQSARPSTALSGRSGPSSSDPSSNPTSALSPSTAVVVGTGGSAFTKGRPRAGGP